MPSVLIVDDEPNIRRMVGALLASEGYEVREAATLADARRQLDGVSVVLLDMHVGAERGETLLIELQEHGIPVAVVTGSTDLDSAGARADAVLGKPFTIDDLEATVARLANRNG